VPAKDRETAAATQRRWRKENPGLAKAQARRADKRRMARVLARYGDRCKCCGEHRPEFLCIDHIHGGGKAHRSQFKNRQTYYCWLAERKRKGLRLLCCNCNFAISAYGKCPHQIERKLAMATDTDRDEWLGKK